jgi:hypothetical protein
LGYSKPNALREQPAVSVMITLSSCGPLKSLKPTCGSWSKILSATVLECITETVSLSFSKKHHFHLQMFSVLSKWGHPADTFSLVLTIILVAKEFTRRIETRVNIIRLC